MAVQVANEDEHDTDVELEVTNMVRYEHRALIRICHMIL